MKKTFSFLLFFASFALLYSCNSGGTGEAYTIELKLNTADSFAQDMLMNMATKMYGIEVNMKMNTVTSFEVLKGGAGEKDIKLTYRKMHIAMDMGQFGKTMPDSIKNRDYNYLIGKSVVMKLSKDNEITDVTGFEEIFNAPDQDSATREMMKKMFSKEQFNNSFGMMFNMYPKKPVKVGETWSGETKMNMANMDMKTTNKYKLLSVKGGLAEISIDGTIGAAGEMLKESSGMKMDMTGTQEGTMIIKMDNGLLQSSSYKMDIKAEMQMMGQKIPMTMKGDYVIKGIK